MNQAQLSPTARTVIRRGHEKAQTDRSELYDLLDSCLVCHLGIVFDDAPVVLPTGYGRDGDSIYIHGSTGAASLMLAAAGAPVSVAVTRLDGVVYARSVFHHSMNYASTVIHGVLEPVEEPDAKLHGLSVITEHLAPGSWAATRQPTRKELAKTAVFSLSLYDASVKMRSGPPSDDEEDVTEAAPWAGVIPVLQTWGDPVPCPLQNPDIPVPPHVVDSRQAPADGQR